MYATTSSERAGVLVTVITGGRPRLRDRKTAQFLPSLVDAGVADVVWAVREDHAESYERDDYDLLTYPKDWSREYAEAHWTDQSIPISDWHGPGPGREWAAREAERRGCWAVLQLDDNIDWLCFLRGTGASKQIVTRHGGMALFLDLLAGVTLSTNAAFVGASTDYTSPSTKQAQVIARPGFPYSCYIERVGPGREEWFGPYEEDILHALQYGNRSDGVTAAVMPSLHYKKNTSNTKGGNRPHYGPTSQRAVGLQRLFPEAAKVGVRATHSNGRGQPRIFHTMLPGAIRNQLTIRDAERYALVRGKLQAMTDEWYAGELAANREKVRRRTEQAQRMRDARLRQARSPSVIVPAPDVLLPSEADVAASDGRPVTP
jgi:hypothetical protein